MEKSFLRDRLNGERRRLEKCHRVAMDSAISAAVQEIHAWEKAKTVYSYLSFGSEVDTRALIKAAWAEGKQVALPRCVSGSRCMRWFAVESLDRLEKSPLGVEEPPIIVEHELDGRGDSHSLALVPGLTFDEQGYRLGYGGGYYDRFLSAFAGISVGLCRQEFMCESLETKGVVEPHDVAVDIVVTQDVVFRCKRSW